jgi:APA family basic amino acid/polyamine antiporter
MMPKAGGEYNSRRGVRQAGGVSVCVDAHLAIAASGAAVALVFGNFLNDLCGGTLSPFTLKFVAAAVIGVATVLNLMPTKTSGWTAATLTVVKIALVAGIGIGAFALGSGSWAHFEQRCADGLCEGVKLVRGG